MAQKRLQVIPEDDDESKKPQSRLSINFGIFKFEAAGKFLEQRGSVMGIAVIIGSITAVIILLGGGAWNWFK